MFRSFLALATAILVTCSNGQLTLPFSGTDASATISSFQIIKSGTAGRANTLYITNAANASDVLLVSTVGDGRAGYFQLNNPGSSNQVLRADSNGTGASIFGYMTGTGRAGSFRTSNPSNGNAALYTLTNGVGFALRAESSWTGGAAEFFGRVEMTSNNSNYPGLKATSAGATAIEGWGSTGVSAFGNAQGLFATSTTPTGTAIAATTTGAASTTIWALNSGQSGGGYTAYLQNYSNAGTGVVGYTSSAYGVTYAMKGNAASPDGFGLYSVGKSATTGTKSFQIDHPLDPEHYYLNHFCTEGEEPLNAYSGNAVTDARGYATVQLPAYFESINKDIRYTLTVIDKTDDFVLAKVAQEVLDNRFVIRTSKPKVKVSWRIEATRNDRWVQRYGYQAEQRKGPAQDGKYVQPELYDQPEEKGIHYVRPRDLVGLNHVNRSGH